jgi:drug/metabolite transporter (DMT)-like permease
MLEGLKRTAAADAGIITATLPAVVAALGVLFAGERLSRLQATAVGLSVAGLLLVQALSVQGGSTTLLDKPARIAGAVLVIGGIVLGALSPTAPYRR